MNMETSMRLDHGVTCIDAQYIRPGLACFYLLQQGDEYAVIETGTSHSLAGLEQVMADRGIRPAQIRYVIPTHVHLDHAGGAGAMMKRFADATLLVHPKGARHLVDPRRLIESSIAVYGEQRFRQLYGDIVPVDPGRVREMGDGESVELAGRRLMFCHTRGHADHHFCIWDETSRGWFSGDMFGICYSWFRFPAGDFLLPSTTPTQFDPQAYLDSLARLDSANPERVFLTHYGELAHSRQKSAQLGRQVVAYRDLASRHRGDLVALEKALTAYSLEQIQAFASDLPEAELVSRLAYDLGLNVQGLEVWLARSA